MLPNESALQSLRQVGDVEADTRVDGQVSNLGPRERQLYLARAKSQLRSLQPVDQWISDWVSEVQQLPDWARPEDVQKGQRFFANWDLDIVAVLFCASLPSAYAAAKGVEVLERESQLANAEEVARRIAETGRLLLAVNSPGGLDPGALGYERLRQVRLLHAVIRADLDGGWDGGKFGCPINQEDLLGTLLSFTTVVFRSLDRLGIPASRSDQAAYLHLWAVIGQLLGIPNTSLVLDPPTAEQLTLAIEDQQYATSPAGRHLTSILMREMELSMPWGARKLPRTVVRHLCGDRTADLLGVAPAAWWRPALNGAARLNRVLGVHAGGRRLLQAPSRLLGRSMIRMWIDHTILGSQQPPFQVDGAVLARWRIRTAPDTTRLTVRGKLREVRYRARSKQLARRGSRPRLNNSLTDTKD